MNASVSRFLSYTLSQIVKDSIYTYVCPICNGDGEIYRNNSAGPKGEFGCYSFGVICTNCGIRTHTYCAEQNQAKSKALNDWFTNTNMSSSENLMMKAIIL